MARSLHEPVSVAQARSVAAWPIEASIAEIIQRGGVRMKQLRVIGLALTATFCAGQANAEELTGTLKNIKETGAIIIGYRDSSIPFSYLDDNQKPIGFPIDICYRIVDAVKKGLNLHNLELNLTPLTPPP